MAAAPAIAHLARRQRQGGEPRVYCGEVFNEVLAVDVYMQRDDFADHLERAAPGARSERGYAVVNTAAGFVLTLRKGFNYTRIIGDTFMRRTGLAGIWQ